MELLVQASRHDLRMFLFHGKIILRSWDIHIKAFHQLQKLWCPVEYSQTWVLENIFENTLISKSLDHKTWPNNIVMDYILKKYFAEFGRLGPKSMPLIIYQIYLPVTFESNKLWKTQWFTLAQNWSCPLDSGQLGSR